MTTGSSRQQWMWLAALVLLLILIAAQAARGQAATTVRLETPRDNPMPGGDPFVVSMVVNDVANLGAFQFQLSYDPEVIELQEVKEGPFLGSSGRPVECLPPRKSEGFIDFTCVTLGPTPDGPTGSGQLATITFKPLDPGTSPLHFDLLILADPPANRLPALAEDSSITVRTASDGGFRWLLWGPIIGGVAIALAAAAAVAWRLRMRPR